MVDTLHTTRPLIYDGFESTSNSEDDDYPQNGRRNNGNFTRNGPYRLIGRAQHHRCTRRLTRWILISGTFIVILLLIYIPLYNHAQSRLVPIPGWDFNTSRNTIDYIFPHMATALIEPKNLCSEKIFLIIFVCSSVQNFAARQTIRETWGNASEFNYPVFASMHSRLSGQYLDVKELSLRMYAEYLNQVYVTNFNISSHHTNFPIRILFLVGKEKEDNIHTNETISRLKLEAAQYDDIIQEDFIDTYNNLTIKSVMMLKWITMNCYNKVKFVMKCDDDTFVNVPNLLHVLVGGTVPVYNSTVEYHDVVTYNALAPANRMTLSRNLLTGYLFCQVKPVADVYSKWYSPMYMYSKDTYPNYLSGSSYLMSFDVILKLYNASLNTPLLHLEDVYLTGICAEKIHVHRRHNPLFSFGHSPNKCTYKGTITQHYLKGDLMKEIYDFVINMTMHCPPLDKSFKVKRLKKLSKYCQ